MDFLFRLKKPVFCFSFCEQELVHVDRVLLDNGAGFKCSCVQTSMLSINFRANKWGVMYWLWWQIELFSFSWNKKLGDFANRLGFVCPYVWGDSSVCVCVCMSVHTAHVDSFLS